MDDDVGSFRVGPISVSPLLGRSNLKFTPRRSMTTFCGQPSGPTIEPAAELGHLSTQLLTPSLSSSSWSQVGGGGGAGAAGGGGGAGGVPKRDTREKPSNQSP